LRSDCPTEPPTAVLFLIKLSRWIEGGNVVAAGLEELANDRQSLRDVTGAPPSMAPGSGQSGDFGTLFGSPSKT
jgi:hypothetical protein